MKYTYSFSENRVYCMTYYAGKTIRGIAKRDPEDDFDLEAGKKLAKARCDYKLYKAKLKRKVERALIAQQEFDVAAKHLNIANMYQEEATAKLQEARRYLEEVEASMR